MVMPVTVLVVNLLLVREMRRASQNAAANLGPQQHHQSAVPTVMLVTTSLVYVLLLGAWGSSYFILQFHDSAFFRRLFDTTWSLGRFAYAYNFYVYLITGTVSFRPANSLLSLFFFFFFFCCCCRCR